MAYLAIICTFKKPRGIPHFIMHVLHERPTLLSRAGYSPAKQIKIEQASMSIHLTGEDIEEIKKRAIESGAVIDVESRSSDVKN